MRALSLTAWLFAAPAFAGVSAPPVPLNTQGQLAAAPALPPIRQQLWQAAMPFWGVSVAPAQTTQFTLGEDFSLDGRFIAIQLILANPAAAVTLPSVRVAPSATAASVTTPRDGSGGTVTWSTVTCGGSASCSLPAGSAAQPSLTLSDPLPIQSLARTDGGKFSLLYTRLLTPATNASWQAGYLSSGMGSLDLTAYATASGGRSVGLYYGGGDFVSSQAAANVLVDSNAVLGSTYSYVAGVRYLSPDRVVTIMGCGDSLTAGFATASGYAGFGLQASVALSNRLGIGVSYVAHGYPGQTSTDFIANCRTAVTLLHPAAVTLPVDSPNDWTGVSNVASGATQAAATAAQDPVRIAMQQRALDLADTVLSYGGLPVLVTPIPFAGYSKDNPSAPYTGGYDAASQYGAQRALAGAFARTLSARAGIVLDAQRIISGYVPTTSTVPVLPKSCIAADYAHLSDTCQGNLATALVSALIPRL